MSAVAEPLAKTGGRQRWIAYDPAKPSLTGLGYSRQDALAELRSRQNREPNVWLDCEPDNLTPSGRAMRSDAEAMHGLKGWIELPRTNDRTRRFYRVVNGQIETKQVPND